MFTVGVQKEGSVRSISSTTRIDNPFLSFSLLFLFRFNPSSTKPRLSVVVSFAFDPGYVYDTLKTHPRPLPQGRCNRREQKGQNLHTHTRIICFFHSDSHNNSNSKMGKKVHGGSVASGGIDYYNLK